MGHKNHDNGVMVQLSDKSIKCLRSLLRKSYGADFEVTLSDEDLQEIGNAMLIVTAEHLKVKACVS